MQELLDKQANITRWIKSLRQGLPYADHGAYGQDKARIYELEQELAQVNKQIEALKGAE